MYHRPRRTQVYEQRGIVVGHFDFVTEILISEAQFVFVVGMQCCLFDFMAFPCVRFKYF